MLLLLIPCTICVSNQQMISRIIRKMEKEKVKAHVILYYVWLNVPGAQTHLNPADEVLTFECHVELKTKKLSPCSHTETIYSTHNVVL